MPVRLKDIAAELGVSAVTVSKVLRGKPDVGEETRRRVLQKIREVHYQPNLLARGLASGKSKTVGLIVPDLVHAFFAAFAKSLKASLRKRGYQLLVASAEEETFLEREEIHTLLARGVDALLIATCQSEAELLECLHIIHIPCILIDRAVPSSNKPFVGTDDVAAGRLATEHLLRIGCKQIAHIAGSGFSTGHDRLQGYKDALAAAGVPLREELIVTRSRLEERGDIIGESATQELLERGQHPDAIFCYNDLVAMGAIRAALTAGFRVPEDLAVIGCGNLQVDDYLHVPLSSIDQATQAQGELAGRLTVDMIDGKSKVSDREVRVAPKLVTRASTTM